MEKIFECIKDIITDTEKEIVSDLRYSGISKKYVELNTISDVFDFLKAIYDTIMSDSEMLDYLKNMLQAHADIYVCDNCDYMLQAIIDYIDDDDKFVRICNKLNIDPSFVENEKDVEDNVNILVYNCLLFKNELIIKTSLYENIINSMTHIIAKYII